MHAIMLLLALGIAGLLRWGSRWRRTIQSDSLTWNDRWIQTLSTFLLPVLLMITTLVAIVWMGPQGHMLGQPVGWISYGMAGGAISWAMLTGGIQLWQSWRTVQPIHTYPIKTIADQQVRVLNSPYLFAAQIGVWQPELVISAGLLERLDPDHIEAVLLHEQAHRYFRDSFWFFGLAWIRRFTGWLPYTEVLWRELLILRELRADRWAATKVDPLILAEALLRVAGDLSGYTWDPDLEAMDEIPSTWNPCPPIVGLVQGEASNDRLQERIEALLDKLEPSSDRSAANTPPIQPWINGILWFLPALLPLITIPFHS